VTAALSLLYPELPPRCGCRVMRLWGGDEAGPAGRTALECVSPATSSRRRQQVHSSLHPRSCPARWLLLPPWAPPSVPAAVMRSDIPPKRDTQRSATRHASTRTAWRHRKLDRGKPMGLPGREGTWGTRVELVLDKLLSLEAPQRAVAGSGAVWKGLRGSPRRGGAEPGSGDGVAGT